MKIFQIYLGFCHWDATKKHPTIESTQGRYSPETLFVEAPDYVFEGWGYNPEETGDARFIQPEAPEGWIYHAESGTFYEEGFEPVIHYGQGGDDENISAQEALDIIFGGEVI